MRCRRLENCGIRIGLPRTRLLRIGQSAIERRRILAAIAGRAVKDFVVVLVRRHGSRAAERLPMMRGILRKWPQ
jgi:hypothetical protein